jgi:hypothetical protein
MMMQPDAVIRRGAPTSRAISRELVKREDNLIFPLYGA